MVKKLFRILLTLMGVAIGVALVSLVNKLFIDWGYPSLDVLIPFFAVISIYAVSAVAFGLIFFFFSSRAVDRFLISVEKLEEHISSMSVLDILLCVLGLIIGLFIAYLLSLMIQTIPIPYLPTIIDIVVYATLGYLGWRVMYRRKGDIQWPLIFKRGKSGERGDNSASIKLLDTCTIIDGRILDVCFTGFIEGTLIIPLFVLDELRHIADSPDPLRRNRGRRGLDILNRMQKELSLPIKVDDTDYDDIAEADSKLIRLAGEKKAMVITTDYNLNKVAVVQSVKVLNINDLANAIKPILLPGEDIKILISKEGKEYNQGVAYLDDGTMIVVENGRKYIGSDIEATVTSVLQTSAGRMIFAKAKFD
ncbi:MAG: hypothetical protein RRY79_03090 [Clostridia bacterium]